MALERTRWDIVGLALSAGYVVGLQVGKVPPALPMLQEELALARVSACLAGAAAHAPGQAQVAMASGFVVQGAALGSLLGPPLLAVVTSVFGG